MILLQDDSLSIPDHAGVNPTNIYTNLIWSSISMDPLLRIIVTDQIFIHVHLSSDAMLCYLHNHYLPFIHNIYCIMFQGGHYSLLTHHIPYA